MNFFNSKIYLIFYFISSFLGKSEQDMKKLCMSMESFYNQYSKDLKGYSSLEDFFSKSKEIGRGGFGSVVEANLNSKNYVIKQVITDEKSSPLFLLVNEITILKKIKESQIENSYLLDYEDCVFDVINKKVYIITEKLSKDLQDYYLENISDFMRIELYIKIALGVQQLHNLKYAHLDIKSENIMVTDNSYETPKIIDFGLSSAFGTKMLGGTPLFYPFENFDDDSALATPMADINALGVTFAVLEIGSIKSDHCLESSWGFTNSQIWSSYHKNLANLVNENYPNAFQNPNIFVKFFRYFKSYFVDNRIERIYNMYDLLVNMTNNNPKERLDISSIIEILKKIQIANKDVEIVHSEVDHLKIIDSLLRKRSIVSNLSFNSVEKIIQKSEIEKAIKKSKMERILHKSEIINIIL